MLHGCFPQASCSPTMVRAHLLKGIVFAFVASIATLIIVFPNLTGSYGTELAQMVSFSAPADPDVAVTPPLESSGTLRGALDSSPKVLETRRKCYRMGAWGDICKYENMCFDGHVWTMLDPRSKNMDPASEYDVDAPRDMLEGYLVPSRPVPSEKTITFPFNSSKHPRSRQISI